MNFGPSTADWSVESVRATERGLVYSSSSDIPRVLEISGDSIVGDLPFEFRDGEKKGIGFQFRPPLGPAIGNYL